MTAGRRDVGATTVADQGEKAAVAEDLLEFFYPDRFGAPEGEWRGLVVGQQVDPAGEFPQQVGEPLGVLGRVVDPGEQDVLDEDHLSAAQGKGAQGFHEPGQGIGAIHRHQPVAGGVVGGVERDGEIHFDVAAEIPDPFHQAAGGDGEPPFGELEPLLVHEDGERFDQVCVVGQGFAHAHEDQIVDILPRG